MYSLRAQYFQLARKAYLSLQILEHQFLLALPGPSRRRLLQREFGRKTGGWFTSQKVQLHHFVFGIVKGEVQEFEVSDLAQTQGHLGGKNPEAHRVGAHEPRGS